MELIYKDGAGGNLPAVYEGASSDGLKHKIRLESGLVESVDASHLMLLHQPDLTNLPSTPFDYQKEVQSGYISTEDAVRLARPKTLSPLQQLLMSWHHRLYHLPFRRIFMLAERGYLPKSLLKCRDNTPLCVACQFGAAHRCPWRVKGKRSGSIRRDNEVNPGNGTSIDQIISSQPGLIPQMSGFLTGERIWGATTICDHVSDYVHCHLMKNLTLEETLTAKHAWEKIMAQAGRVVKHYHADNGRFADEGFKAACNDHDQRLTFCGVGAHHQAGIIEGKNRVLTQGARTLLLHGIRMWPQMINSMFWPFVLKAMAERVNKLHISPDGATPESILYGVSPQEIRVASFHTLFCPVYVLDSKLHNAGSIGPPKWEPRSRIGVYLGHSPFHAGSVALVFNPATGHVSPQFHVVFDNDFSTVPFMQRAIVPPNWNELYNTSRELATDEEFDLADSWFRMQADTLGGDGPSRPITDPFAIVTGPNDNANDIRTPHATSIIGNIGCSLASDYKGEKSIPMSPLTSINREESAAPLPLQLTVD